MYQRPEASLSHRDQKSWEKIQTHENGQFDDEEGLWTFSSIFPLIEGHKSSSGTQEAFAPSLSQLEAKEYYWKAVLFIPDIEYNVPLQTRSTRLFIEFIFIIFIVSFGSWKMVIYRSRQMEAENEKRLVNLNLENTVEKRTHDLEERGKELRGLYSLSEALNTSQTSVENALKDSIDIISNAWQYPEITCARITFNNTIYVSKNFEETTWGQASDIIIDESKVGAIEIFYLEEKPELYEGPFLKEERDLIDEMADRVGRYIKRWNAENKIQEQANLHKAITDHSPLAIYMSSGIAQRAEYINPAFIKLFGYRIEEVATVANWWPIAYPDTEYRQQIETEWQQRATRAIETESEIEPMDTVVTCKDGSTKNILWSFFSNGDQNWAFGLDLTERIEMELIARQSYKLDAVGNLAGGIAHDVNNMLLPIIALTEMTMKGLPEGSRDQKRLEKVLEAGTKAKDLIAGIMDFSHRDDTATKKEEVNIEELIRGSLGLLRSTIPSNITLNDNLDPDTGVILCDSSQISTILMNMGANTIAAMAGKVGELNISVAPVNVTKQLSAKVSGLATGRFAKLTISDTASGMNANTLEHLFDPFFTTKGVGEGTGLGLSMAHGIITKHAGAIAVSSELGVGTTFDIYLPLVE